MSHNHKQLRIDKFNHSNKNNLDLDNDRIKRDNFRMIGRETFRILQIGEYTINDMIIDIEQLINNSIAKTELITPEDYQCINLSIEEILKPKLSLEERTIQGLTSLFNTEFIVTTETSIKAAEKYTKYDGKVIILNFASATKPGGGFMNGAQAQEEHCARSSSLYSSLSSEKVKEFYTYHKQHNNPSYSDYMIYSPNVVVFRNENEELVENYYLVDFISSPAPNLSGNKNTKSKDIYEILVRRIDKILNICSHKTHETIILGSWGCGVFKNDIQIIADIFVKLVTDRYNTNFQNVVFACPDINHADIFRKKLAQNLKV